MRAWIRWHLLRHLDDLRDGTRARALLHLGLSLLGDPAEQEAEIERLRLKHGRRARQGAESALGRIDELTKERDELRAMLADKAVLLQEVARLRDEVATERRRYAFAAEYWGAADIEALRARLREQATPLTYKEGDRPRLPEMVLWRSEGIWAPLHRDCLRPGDLWLPMPPPPEGQR